MKEKKCFKCNLVKPLSEFYKHKGMLDGHLNKCKECTKLDTKVNTKDKLEYYRAYDKARAHTEKRKQQKAENRKKFRAMNPLAYKAHSAVSHAIKKGTLVKEPCYCGAIKVEAHHPDYNQPLFVIWLCNKHHKHIHNRTAY